MDSEMSNTYTLFTFPVSKLNQFRKKLKNVIEDI
jgi:hypothetical protein